VVLGIQAMTKLVEEDILNGIGINIAGGTGPSGECLHPLAFFRIDINPVRSFVIEYPGAIELVINANVLTPS